MKYKDLYFWQSNIQSKTPPAIGGVIPFLIPLIFKSHKFEKSKMAKSLFLQLFNSVSLQKINFKITDAGHGVY